MIPIVVKQYGDLPEVECYPGQINQVFMNLLANAIDAIEEKLEKSGKDFQPTIKVITEQPDEQRVIIRIVDNGKGINNDIRERILQPLFTTKPINKGTGLGLSIAHQIIVDKHGGKLSFISLLEQGTEFMIELPLGKEAIGDR
jgi:signal transduction histidine kinase